MNDGISVAYRYLPKDAGHFQCARKVRDQVQRDSFLLVFVKLNRFDVGRRYDIVTG